MTPYLTVRNTYNFSRTAIQTTEYVPEETFIDYFLKYYKIDKITPDFFIKQSRYNWKNDDGNIVTKYWFTVDTDIAYMVYALVEKEKVNFVLIAKLSITYKSLEDYALM